MRKKFLLLVFLIYAISGHAFIEPAAHPIKRFSLPAIFLYNADFANEHYLKPNLARQLSPGVFAEGMFFGREFYLKPVDAAAFKKAHGLENSPPEDQQMIEKNFHLLTVFFPEEHIPVKYKSYCYLHLYLDSANRQVQHIRTALGSHYFNDHEGVQRMIDVMMDPITQRQSDTTKKSWTWDELKNSEEYRGFYDLEKQFYLDYYIAKSDQDFLNRNFIKIPLNTYQPNYYHNVDLIALGPVPCADLDKYFDKDGAMVYLTISDDKTINLENYFKARLAPELMRNATVAEYLQHEKNN